MKQPTDDEVVRILRWINADDLELLVSSEDGIVVMSIDVPDGTRALQLLRVLLAEHKRLAFIAENARTMRRLQVSYATCDQNTLAASKTAEKRLDAM